MVPQFANLTAVELIARVRCPVGNLDVEGLAETTEGSVLAEPNVEALIYLDAVLATLDKK